MQYLLTLLPLISVARLLLNLHGYGSVYLVIRQCMYSDGNHYWSRGF